MNSGSDIHLIMVLKNKDKVNDVRQSPCRTPQPILTKGARSGVAKPGVPLLEYSIDVVNITYLFYRLSIIVLMFNWI